MKCHLLYSDVFFFKHLLRLAHKPNETANTISRLYPVLHVFCIEPRQVFTHAFESELTCDS